MSRALIEYCLNIQCAVIDYCLNVDCILFEDGWNQHFMNIQWIFNIAAGWPGPRAAFRVVRMAGMAGVARLIS